MLDVAFISRYYQPSYAARVAIDGTPILANMIQSRLPESGMVVDLGAGRGSTSPHPCRRAGITVIGVDSDAEVSENQGLDNYFVQDAESLPFETSSIDAVFSDFTLEHLKAPEKVLAEVSRVLRPGAPFVFRTVNALHYVAICASVFRGNLRRAALRQSGRSVDETFPTYYRLNTKRAITRGLRDHAFEIEEMVLVEGPPVYLTFSKTLYRLGVLYERFANGSSQTDFLRANIICAARKSDEIRNV